MAEETTPNVAVSAEPPGQTPIDLELEAKRQASEGATTVPVEGDVEGAGEGEAAAETDQENKPAEKSAEEQLFDVDGEEVPLKVLQEAYKKSDEVAVKVKQVNEVVSALKTQPADTLLQIFTAQQGGDREKGYAALVDLAERVLAFHIEREKLSPEERELHATREENKRLKAEREEREAAAQKAAEEEAVAEAAEEIAEEMATELKAAGVPDSARIRQRVAAVVSAKWAKGLSSYTVADGVRAVKAALSKEEDTKRKEWLGQIKPEDLTPEQLETIRSHSVTATKANLAGSKTGASQESKGGKVFLPKRVASIV